MCIYFCKPHNEAGSLLYLEEECPALQPWPTHEVFE